MPSEMGFEDPYGERLYSYITFTSGTFPYQESDINCIVKKYADGRTGITTLDLGADAGVLQYGDTLLPGDYDTALDLINAVSDEFYQLPAQIRAEFNHNPKELINALADPRQRDRLLSLGLLQQDTVVPSSAGSSQNEDNGTSSKKQNETQTNEST